MDIFAVAEHREGQLASISFELLNLANLIKGGGKSNAIVFGKTAGVLANPAAGKVGLRVSLRFGRQSVRLTISMRW